MADEFCLKMSDFHVTFKDILHAVNLRHGTDGFTSPRKEGMLRIFCPQKSNGFGRVWTRELGLQRPSTLPLDHRSRQLACLVLCIHWKVHNIRRQWTVLSVRPSLSPFLCLNFRTPERILIKFYSENLQLHSLGKFDLDSYRSINHVFTCFLTYEALWYENSANNEIPTFWKSAKLV